MTGQPIGEPTWSPAGEGEQLWFVGTLATIRVPGEAVGGRYALIEFLFPRGASPPRHTHPQDESYIVVDGLLTVQAGERRFELGPGGTAAVPMGVAHTFASTARRPASWCSALRPASSGSCATGVSRPRQQRCHRPTRHGPQLKSWPRSSRHTDKSTSVHRWAPMTDRADPSGIGTRSRAASDDSCLSCTARDTRSRPDPPQPKGR